MDDHYISFKRFAFLAFACSLLFTAYAGNSRSSSLSTTIIDDLEATMISLSASQMALVPTLTVAEFEHKSTESTATLLPIREEEYVTQRDGKLWLGETEFRFVGNNAYFLQPEIIYGNLAEVQVTLDQMAAMGMSVVRTIGFNAHDSAADPAAIQLSPGEYSEESLVALDQVIAEAKARNIRVILYLTNNWEAYGGVGAYLDWCACKASHQDFYTNEKIIGFYQDYVAMLLNRTNTVTGIPYREDSTILAWELGNELRNPGVDPMVLLNWTEEMAAFIKTHDPHHLVADGGEGFDDDPNLYEGLTNSYAVRGVEGASYHRLVSLESVHLVSYHLYPDKWGFNDSSDVVLWIKTHEELARQAGKVAYLGEFGIINTRENYSDLLREWLVAALVEADSTGVIIWQMVTSSRLQYDDGYSLVCPDEKTSCALLSVYASGEGEPLEAIPP